MYCPNCGASNAESARFCTSCGTPLARVDSPETTAEPKNTAQRQPAPHTEALASASPTHPEHQEPSEPADADPAADASADTTIDHETPASAPAATNPARGAAGAIPLAGICTMRAIAAALYALLLLSLGIGVTLQGEAVVRAVASLGQPEAALAAIVLVAPGIALALLLSIASWGFACALPRRKVRAASPSARTPRLVAPLACALVATAAAALFIALRLLMLGASTGAADPAGFFGPAVECYSSWALPQAPLLAVALILAFASTVLGHSDRTQRAGSSASSASGGRALVCLVVLALAVAGGTSLSGCTSCSSPSSSESTASQGSDASSEPVDSAAEKDAEAPSRDVILALDVSGSMAGDRLAKMQEAAKTFVDVVMGERTRVGLISYAQDANVLADLTDDEAALTQGIDALTAAGDTDIEASLRQAEQMLVASDADQKIIVLMSDGEPTEGLAGDNLIAYAGTLKDKGTRIYTIGLSESSEGHTLQLAIANEGCHYDVENADELQGFFSDIASEVSGERYLYVRIAAPRDAAQIDVTYDGETLSSAADGQARTSFGTLAYEDNVSGTDGATQDGVAVLRLKEGPAYDVSITGAADAAMDVTVGLADEAGEYEDQRTFTGIPLTAGTVVSLSAANAERTQLSVSQPAGSGSDAAGSAGSSASEEAGAESNASGGNDAAGTGPGASAAGSTLTYEAGTNESVDASNAANATAEINDAAGNDSSAQDALARARGAAVLVIVATALCTLALAITGCVLLARTLTGNDRVVSCIILVVVTLVAGAFVAWQSGAPRTLLAQEATANPAPLKSEDQNADTGTASVTIGDVSDHVLAPTTRIVPLDSEGNALTDYTATVCRALNAEGLDLGLSDVEPLDIDNDQGFTLNDILGNMADEDGVTCYLSVTDNKEEADQSLPPLRVDSSSNEEKLSVERIVPGSETGTSSAMQAMTFLNKIAQLENLYGAPSVEDVPESSSLSISGIRGLALAKIIDFGDGVPRMLVGYSSDPNADYSDMDTDDGWHLEVWEYDERMGYLRNVWQGEPNVGTGPVASYSARTLSWTQGSATMQALVCDVVEGFGAETPESEILHQMTFVGVRDDGSFGELDVDEISQQWPQTNAWSSPDYTTNYNFIGIAERVSACAQTVDDTVNALQAALDAAHE